LLRSESYTRAQAKWPLIDTAVEELQEVLRDCAPEQHGGAYRFNNAQAAFLDSTLQQHSKWQVNAPTAWKNRVASLSGEAKLECPALGTLENILRPYQRDGVGWLHFLRRNGSAASSPMKWGSAKQCKRWHSFKRPAPNAQRPASLPDRLPTSLVFIGSAKRKKFTPELKVLALTGPDRLAAFSQLESRPSPRPSPRWGEENPRQRWACGHPLPHWGKRAGVRGPQLAEYDLVITSYALIRRDADHHRSLEFDTVILDEAQHIKNRQTQNAQAVKSIRSKHRLVLTGTPLENSVLDLWSIFDFLMPGYLGAAQDFASVMKFPLFARRIPPPKRAWRGGCVRSCSGVSSVMWSKTCPRSWSKFPSAT